MEISAGIDEFVDWIGKVLHAEWEGEADEATYRWRDRDGGPVVESDPELCLNVVDLQEVIDRLNSYTALHETGIADAHHYEVLVDEEASVQPFAGRRLRGEFRLEDSENNLVYEIGFPSDEFLLFLLYRLAQLTPSENFLLRMPPRIVLERLMRDREDTPSVFEALRHFMSGLRTLKISSERERPVTDYDRFANSLYFQLSYNLDLALVPQRSLDEYVRTTRISRLRRVRLDEISFPKRFYTPDLVYHYQLAVAADSPPLQFLSFYHVAEHFFDTVFREDLVERIQDRISSPGFSTKRKRDVEGLINQVTGSLRILQDRVALNELEALRLTLERYGVDVDDLLHKLQDYDKSLITYYASESVSFADGDTKVDMRSDGNGKVLSDLARRIYKTRNAIVHSKQGERGRYVPFQDDKVLAKEVPLIRFVAEAIIIGDSRRIL